MEILPDVFIDKEALAGIFITAWLVLFAASAYGMLAVVLFFGSGLLWAPFAAWLTYRQADAWGVSPKRYALLGGAYSLLSIFLWLNMMTGMRKANWNRFKNGKLYVALFLIWLGSIPVFVFHLFMASIGAYDDLHQPLSPPRWASAATGILAFIVIAWVVSAVTVWVRRASILANKGPSIPAEGLAPFAVALVSTIVATVFSIDFYSSNSS